MGGKSRLGAQNHRMLGTERGRVQGVVVQVPGVTRCLDFPYCVVETFFSIRTGRFLSGSGKACSAIGAPRARRRTRRNKIEAREGAHYFPGVARGTFGRKPSRVGRHRRPDFKLVFTALAEVIVGWHPLCPLSYSDNAMSSTPDSQRRIPHGSGSAIISSLNLAPHR